MYIKKSQAKSFTESCSRTDVLLKLAEWHPLVACCSHLGLDCNRITLDKSILQDKSLTPVRLFVSAFGISRWNFDTPHWVAAAVELKVSSSPCHDRAPARWEWQPCTDWGSRVYLWSIVGAAAGKTYLRPHVRLSERPAEPSLLWSLCAGGTAGPWGLAHTLPSSDAQCSRCSSRRSTAPCTRLPAC